MATDYPKMIEIIRELYPGRQFVPLHEPYFGGNEKKYLQDCIDSTFVSSVGKYVDRFEEMISDFTGAKHAIATVNGTAALHIALLLAGVQRNDLVITQPLTFIATCNAISYCGAEPVFIDIDRQTLGLSADALEAWLSENATVKDDACYYTGAREVHELQERSKQRVDGNTKNRSGLRDKQQAGFSSLTDYSRTDKSVRIREIDGRPKISACVPMHTFGHPCEITRIVEICRFYHIPVVEDAAESIGSYYKGRHTGTFGKLGIFSFNGNKTITTGGGGMILTDDRELGKLAKHITTTAKNPHPWEFVHDMVGYNYRLPNVNAALGCAQMEMLPQILESKRETARAYRDAIAVMDGVRFVTEPPDCLSNYWLNTVVFNSLEKKDAFLDYSNNNGVMTRPAWTLMYKLDMFRNAVRGVLPVAEELSGRLVNIPSSVRKT